MESFERLESGLEFRREGNRLVGPAIRYGDISPTHQERFEPGAFTEDLRDNRTRWLDVEHRVREVIAWSPDGGLSLTDSPEGLIVDASIPAIPAGERALMDVSLRRLTGFSVEFRSLKESRDSAGVRVIQAARLAGVGLTGKPSYPASTLEVRRRGGGRSGRSMRGRIPSGVPLACRCSGSGCRTASFSKPALSKAMDRAFRPTSSTMTIFKDYKTPIASVNKGTLRRDGATGLVVDIPTGAAGEAVEAAAQSTGVIVRPYLDPLTSKGVIEVAKDGSKNMAYNDPDALDIRAFVISSTDDAAGWPEPTIGQTQARSEHGGWLCL